MMEIYCGENDYFAEFDYHTAYILLPLIKQARLYPMDRHELDRCKLDMHIKYNRDLLKMTTKERAACWVLPFHWEETKYNKKLMNAAKTFIVDAARYKKKALVFYNNDDAEKLPIENAVIARTSTMRSKKFDFEVVFPAICDDLLRHYFNGKLQMREMGPKPTVSFCGTLHEKYLGRLWRINKCIISARGKWHLPINVSAQDPRIGAVVRVMGASSLKNSNLVNDKIILRGKHWNGVLGSRGEFDEQAALNSRYEMLLNMTYSDYVFSPRGNGNYSYRLYEAMACGRIPVLVDTDTVMPFDDKIDWERLVLRIRVGDLHNIGEIIYNHYQSMTSHQYRNLQQEIRDTWKSYFSAEGYYVKLCSMLSEGLI